VELDVVTNFSFLRGASHADELIGQAAALGYACIGVADVNSLAGIVRAHEAAKQAKLKLCVGVRLRFTDAPDVLAFAEHRGGYTNLCRLLTLGKRRATKGTCDLRLADLLNHTDGLSMALDPGSIDPESPPAHRDAIIDALDQLCEAIGDDDRLSLVVSQLYGSRDEPRLRELVSLGRARHVPLLATNGVHYHDESRRPLQDMLACVRHGCTIEEAGYRLFPNGERFLKSPEEMRHLFRDLPLALRRSVEVAERCSFSLDELRYEYPADEVVPAGRTAIGYLAELAWTGAAERYPDGVPGSVRQQVAHELVLIEQLKIEAYFLTVHDLVRYARSRGILCQGRGSAANSAVCYCIGVTAVDPSRIDVLFERFVSAARDEPPDIDLDLEHERREEVIQYVYEKYGRHRAAMTAEVITYRGRSAVRDVGKAMGLGADAVDQMAKRLDWWDRGTLTPDKLREVGLDPNDRTIATVIALSGQLLGFPRHLSQHVGGMVMTRGTLADMVPIENATMPDRTVIEWDKDDIDALKILKVDILALGMLTCISKCLAIINGYRAPGTRAIEMYAIPAEDPYVYDMICDADTVGVFQIESRAQMSMLPRLRPRKFYDLVIEVAIVRPGPIQGDMVHPYLRRRNGDEQVTYPSKALEQVLGKTLGVPLFQEQAMRVAMVGAGFSAEEADRFRRAMAAWKRGGAMETFGRKIVDGMVANGYTPQYAEQCFNQLRGFGEYGFPESHSASFALLVYASCWLKRYHPAAFCAALLNSQPMGFYAPAQIVRDAREHGVTVRPVDVNHSDWDCTLEDVPVGYAADADHKRTWGQGGPVVRLGFRMVRGFRVAHAQQIVQARDVGGAFASVDAFHERTNLPVSAIERLSEADAFGSLSLGRRQALWASLALPEHRAPLPGVQPALAPGEQLSLFLPPMPLEQEVRTDYHTIGLSLKGHPVGLLRAELTRIKIITAAQLNQRRQGTWVKVAGLVLIRQRPGTAAGIVFETIEDETGIVNLIIKPDIFDRYRPAARHAQMVAADGYVQRQGQVIHVMVKRMHDLQQMIAPHQVRSRDFH
jgi:error-prone DNA polymerase